MKKVHEIVCHNCTYIEYIKERKFYYLLNSSMPGKVFSNFTHIANIIS